MPYYSDRRFERIDRNLRVGSLIIKGGLLYLLAPAGVIAVVMIVAFILGKINALLFGGF